MRRSICYCDPAQAIAGESRTWNFIYTSANDLPKGTRIKFVVGSQGRPKEWQLPSDFGKSNVIWLEMPNKKSVAAEEGDTLDAFYFTLPAAVETGSDFIIHIGTSLKDQEKNGSRCQSFTQRKKQFIIYVDPKGKNDFKEPDSFQLDIRGGPLHNLRIITPSFVSRNKRFDIIVRFEDAFGNLTNNAPENTLIELSYEHLRENLLWKLFVPETGFITLPNLYFNEPGVYKIQLKNLQSGKSYLSSPVMCFADSEQLLFWGQLHGEFEKIDAAENIESYLRHARDELAFQFIASSCFDSEQETSNEIWKAIVQEISEFNEDERFSAFLGFNWVGTPKEEGLRQFIYLKDNKPLMRKKELKTNSLKKIYKTHNPKDLIAIPSFTMGETSAYDFKDYNPEFERVVEIYNAWGSSECLSNQDNDKPIEANKDGIREFKEGSIRDALNNNCRFGFVAGGLDDRGIYANCYDSSQMQYTPGLTGIIAKEQTREALFSALHKRHCYATTGEKTLLNFFIAGEPMGTELSSTKKPGLVYNRYISGFVVGTKPIKKIELIRNGKVLTTFHPDNQEFHLEFDDSEMLYDITIHDKNQDIHFAYYYLRVEQEHNQLAWSSPIWVDWVKDGKIAKKSKKTKA